MRAPALLHWPQDMTRVQDALQRAQIVVLCIAQPPGTSRPAARANVRLVLQAALGHWLNCPATAVVLHSSPGAPLRLHHPISSVALSISHDAELSLAAIAPRGSVGVDIVSTSVLPDATECLQLARDYLGTDTAQKLAALPAATVPIAFAQAWAMQESRLKCSGLGLQEWEPVPDEEMQMVQTLPLPATYCGAVAWEYPIAQ
jgi:4'-phosphopantetheinyl transferase